MPSRTTDLRLTELPTAAQPGQTCLPRCRPRMKMAAWKLSTGELRRSVSLTDEPRRSGYLAGTRRRIRTKELTGERMLLHHHCRGRLLSWAEHPDVLRRNPTPLTP